MEITPILGVAGDTTSLKCGQEVSGQRTTLLFNSLSLHSQQYFSLFKPLPQSSGCNICYLLLQDVMMYWKNLTISFSESVAILTVDKMFLHSACSALEQLAWCWCALKGRTFRVRVTFISVGGTACSRDFIGWSQNMLLTSLNSESGQQII